MTLMSTMIMIIISSFMMMNHPLFLVLLLLLLTLSIFKSIMMLFNCSWIMMVLFLIFLGGLLIIFTYLSALVPNELEKSEAPWLIMFMGPGLMSMTFMPVWQNTLSGFLLQINLTNEMNFVLFLLLYLLMSLISMMTLSQNLKSPLNQEND